MIEKVDQESEEYLKWKGESVPIEQPQEEENIEELPEPKRKKIFFLVCILAKRGGTMV